MSRPLRSPRNFGTWNRFHSLRSAEKSRRTRGVQDEKDAAARRGRRSEKGVEGRGPWEAHIGSRQPVGLDGHELAHGLLGHLNDWLVVARHAKGLEQPVEVRHVLHVLGCEAHDARTLDGDA